MNIKSDLEVAQRWQTQNQIGNFEANLSMMVSKPYEANLGREKAKKTCQNSRKYFWSKNCFGRVETRFPQVEGVKPEARGGPRGLRKGQTKKK